jgi:hypothetical protein
MMIKRYGPLHWGVFILLSRARHMWYWHPAYDVQLHGPTRRYAFVTILLHKTAGVYESRIRFGASRIGLDQL